MTGAELYQARMALGLTQSALADRLGTTGRSVSRWETSGAVPPYVALCLEAIRWRKWWETQQNLKRGLS